MSQQQQQNQSKHYYSDALGIYSQRLLLTTPEDYFKRQIQCLKETLKKEASKLNTLNKLLVAQEDKFEELKTTYMTFDRKLAFRDGRLRTVKPHLVETNYKMPPIVRHRNREENKKDLKTALSLMTVAEKEELLKDLLR